MKKTSKWVLVDQVMIDRFAEATLDPAAQVFNIDDVIDPRETRMRINRALEMSRLRRSVPARPPVRAGVMP